MIEVLAGGEVAYSAVARAAREARKKATAGERASASGARRGSRNSSARAQPFSDGSMMPRSTSAWRQLVAGTPAPAPLAAPPPYAVFLSPSCHAATHVTLPPPYIAVSHSVVIIGHYHILRPHHQTFSSRTEIVIEERESSMIGMSRVLELAPCHENTAEAGAAEAIMTERERAAMKVPAAASRRRAVLRERDQRRRIYHHTPKHSPFPTV